MDPMVKITSITGIGRMLEPELRSHRVVLGGAMLGGVAYLALALATERNVADAPLVSVSVFLAWAVTRELDPDRPHIAVWAMPVAFAALVYVVPSALASAVILIGIRLVAGTVGAAVTRLDVAVFVLLGFAAGASPILWTVALTMAIWLWSAPEVGGLKYAALGSLIAGVGLGLSLSDTPDVPITQEAYVLAAFAGIVMMLAMQPKTVASATDARTGQVHAARVGLARKAAGGFLMWAAVMGGVPGFWMLSPVLAALGVTAFAKWLSPGA